MFRNDSVRPFPELAAPPLTILSQTAEPKSRWPGPKSVGGVLVLLWLTLSYLGVQWHADLVDREWQQQLLDQAVFLAENLNVDLIRPLSFGPEDRERPEFQRLTRYFKDYLSVIGCRGIYTLAARNGRLLFGPESYEPDDPQASPPGTVYQQPSPELVALFHQPRPFTKGPWTDEYGTFLSALAPVLDPQTGQVLLALGLDVEAADWQATLRRVRLAGGALALAWGLLLGFCFWLWQQKARWRWVPVWLTLILGLALTATAVLLLADAQRHGQRAVLQREAANRAEFVIRNFRNLETQTLAIAGRFFESSPAVSREEFFHLTAPLWQQGTATALLWLPLLPAAQRYLWEDWTQAAGYRDPPIWELTPAGQPVPAAQRAEYFPVLYLAPEQQRVLGYDLGSDPGWRARLTAAATSGLPVAGFCPPSLAQEPEELLCCRPVYRRDRGQKKLLGWLAARVKAAVLLSSPKCPEKQEPMLAVSLWLMVQGEGAKLVAGDGQTASLPAVPAGGWPPLPLPVFPVLVCGQTLALVFAPLPAFWRAYSSLALSVAAVSGVLLTLMGALLAWSVIRRRLELEDLLRRRTAALQDRETYLATLLDILGDGVFVTTYPERRIVYVNRAGAAIFGRQPEELVGQATKILYYSTQEHQRYGDLLAAALARGDNQTRSEIQFRHRDGSLVWGEAQTVFLRQEQESLLLISVVRDITGRKKMEEEREQLQQQLFQAQKMEAVGRLASGIAHDFNNFLSLILGQMELLLLDLPSGSPWRQPCELILEAGQRAANLTRQLLIFTRQQPATPEVVDLNEVIAGQLKLLSHFLSENIALSWRPAPGLWPVRIDPQQLQQVLSNLLINARDAITGTGEVAIETANVRLDEEYCRIHFGVSPGAYVLLTVSDTGCGMDKETLSRIFEPFFTTKPAGQGTGLGLATVYGIVRQWGGQILVYSEVGQGTTFKIYLPAVIGKPSAAAAGSVIYPQAGQETILVVEDDPQLLQVTQQLLEHLGYRVLVAAEPQQALELARNYPGEIQLLLTDVIMPGLNGRELYERLVAERPRLKVLYTSGYAENVISRDGILLAEAAFLPKPFSLPRLAAKIREVLSSG